MQQFKLQQSGFKDVRKKMLVGGIPLALIAVIGGMFMSMNAANDANFSDALKILPIVIPIGLIAVGVGLYKGIRRQQILFASYTLTLTENMISREMQNTPTINLYFNEIIEITKQKNGGFTVKGREPADIIAIPLHIENYTELEVMLQNIQPIATARNQRIWERYPAILALGTILMMLGVYVSKNKVVVALTGTSLVVLLSWSFFAIQKNKNIDRRTKKLSWWTILVLVSIIANMIFKLTGWGH